VLQYLQFSELRRGREVVGKTLKKIRVRRELENGT
jgi:hypothetical protein